VSPQPTPDQPQPAAQPVPDAQEQPEATVTKLWPRSRRSQPLTTEDE
jgi:hypothetical protein